MTGALAGLVCFALPADAQPIEGHALGPSGAYTEIRLMSPVTGDRTLAGVLLGAEGNTSWWRLELDVDYRQGRVRRSGPVSEGADVRVGQALLGVSVLPWITVQAGPRLLQTDASEGHRRSLRWQVGASVSAPLVPGWIHGFGSAVGSVAGSGLEPRFYTGRGGIGVGLTVTTPGLPVWATAGYRMDREGGSVGPRSVEMIHFTVGMRVGH